MSADLSPFLARVPELRGIDPFACTRLGGLTNRNYRIEVNHDDRYVLRIPGEGTSEYINRANEEVAARASAAAGVNAEVVFFDARDGLMVTRLVDDARTMTPEGFQDLAAIARAGEIFRQLHQTSQPFSTEFRLFDMIDEYKTLLASKHATLPDGYAGVQELGTLARLALQRQPAPLVASHCDPLCENFLDTGSRMYLIDYEYAGNNDPMWDLGDLSVEGGFTAEQDSILMRAYFQGMVPAEQTSRMVIYKALCDLVWTLWGVIQHVNDNPAEDFWAYATNRFLRCRALMTSPEFASHLGVAGHLSTNP
jgi:thiamine kinase-like enzyme